MSIEEPSATDHLPILRDRSTERNVFSLEMGPEGVRLRLGGVGLQDWLLVKDLVLVVPHVPRSFDYTAGPRSLQSELTRLEAVVVEVQVDRLADRLRGSAGIDVTGTRVQEVRVVVSGVADGVPFTLRLDPGRPEDGGPGDLEVRFEDPRVFGWIGRPWDRLGESLAAGLPEAVRASVRRSDVRLEVLRPVLTPLLCGMGCKVPLLDEIGLADIRFEAGRLVLAFASRMAPGRSASSGPLPEPSADSRTPEAEALEALDAFARGDDPTAGARLLTRGVVVPRLWPEVLVGARALGEDRPEWVLPHLVGLLLATRMPELIPASEVVLLARRLLAAVEASGDRADLSLAGRLVATISFDLPPRDALDLVDGVRGRGVSDPAVLEAAALALDRLGRGAEARAARARLLALAPTGRIPEVLRSVVDRLDRAGLQAVASGWLDETIARCDEGRFGSEGAGIRRRSLLLCAARESLAGDPGGRRRLLDLLRQDPQDREALDLLLVTSRTDREASEAVARLREAADAVSGAERSALLRDAARASADRLGLRRQAVALLEEALVADPRDVESADALDRLCSELGMDDRRLALALARLALTTEPEARVCAQLRVARLAEQVGDLAEASRCLQEILDGDPTNREALEAGIRVFAGRGDESALVRAWETLLDLDARRS